MVKPKKEPENILVALPQANLRLKAAKIPVQIVLLSNGNKLGLQATLPDKKDPNARGYQQKISLGVPANLEGLEYGRKQKPESSVDCWLRDNFPGHHTSSKNLPKNLPTFTLKTRSRDLRRIISNVVVALSEQNQLGRQIMMLSSRS